MTIEEKRLKIKEHCNRMHDCSDCDLRSNCFNMPRFVSDEEVEELYNILICGTATVTRNMAEVSDTFICEKCRVHLEDCARTVYDEDAEDTTYQYKYKFCPECGRKVVEK